jgi:hypothetical protein
MRASRVTPSKFDVRRGISWGMASVLMGLVAYPPIEARLGAMRAAARLEKLEANPDRLAGSGEWMDSNLSLRVQRLGPLLASWETIGGCGAGGTGGSVGVKWIGHNTTGGLFHSTLMLNYLAFNNGYNLIALAQLDRDIDQGQKWNVGVIVPVLYKYYSNYLQVRPPVSISNSGLGDINAYVTRRLGPINATSITAALGFPTGTHDAQYKFDYLTQDKQLGLGNFTGSLMIDHTIDESWGLIVLGGLGAYRGGRNDLGSYRAPTGTLYSYAGYFLGPLVPALGVSVTGFTGKDQDRGIDQDLPLVLIAGNASIEWSTDWIAILAGVSFPFSTDAQLQPWLVALGVSVSPF